MTFQLYRCSFISKQNYRNDPQGLLFQIFILFSIMNTYTYIHICIVAVGRVCACMSTVSAEVLEQVVVSCPTWVALEEQYVQLTAEPSLWP